MHLLPMCPLSEGFGHFPDACRAWQGEIGKGAFQELDQVHAVKPFTKYAGQAKSAAEIPAVLKAAIQAAVSGRPGPSYVDIPSDVLMASSSSEVSCFADLCHRSTPMSTSSEVAVIMLLIWSRICQRHSRDDVSVSWGGLCRMAAGLQVSAEESGEHLANGLRQRAQASGSSIQQAADLLKQAQRCATVKACRPHL